MVSTRPEAPTCDDTAKVDSGEAAAVVETHASTIFLVGVEGVVDIRPAVGYRLDDPNHAVSAGFPPY